MFAEDCEWTQLSRRSRGLMRRLCAGWTAVRFAGNSKQMVEDSPTFASRATSCENLNNAYYCAAQVGVGVAHRHPALEVTSTLPNLLRNSTPAASTLARWETGFGPQSRITPSPTQASKVSSFVPYTIVDGEYFLFHMCETRGGSLSILHPRVLSLRKRSLVRLQMRTECAEASL